ncbi:MAG: hypothetical protein JO288_15465 [Hyphomicrobiales bacterium]|nr:hypothetical protein [Hyphomicrobiales bacterium]
MQRHVLLAGVRKPETASQSLRQGVGVVVVVTGDAANDEDAGGVISRRRLCGKGLQAVERALHLKAGATGDGCRDHD